ncbi:MAG: helix-hairpin-helix domain-containing protein, partial [Candidatus Competibacteraceae bacterium]|nr:helix-hairpin-helix domain-containing protein [Candidatus Competibacteraceae bacterium]
METLSGTVARITFHNPDNGFCVLRVQVGGRREPVTVVGSAAVVSPGEHLQGEGRWVNDRTHGLQFKAEQLHITPPATLAGIEKYLGSGMVRGIGPHFAAKLVRAFGQEVFEVIEDHPERLTELPGIGPKRRAQVVAAWVEQRVVRDIMVFLQSFGLGSARAVRIYKTYGEAAIDRVRENPYRLAADIRGIGFDGADRLARQLGLAADSPLRARAGLRHMLQTFTQQGHCAARREELLEATVRLLDMEPPIVEAALAAEIEAGWLVPETVVGELWIFPASLARAEV